jgi:hypothetical protein
MNAERRKTLLQTNPQPGRIVVLMLVVSMALFLAGIFRPFTAVTKLWVFENQISVVSGLITLCHYEVESQRVGLFGSRSGFGFFGD